MPEFASGSDNIFSPRALDCFGPFSRTEITTFFFNSIISTSSVSSKLPKLLSENALYLTFHFFREPHIMAFTLFL